MGRSVLTYIVSTKVRDLGTIYDVTLVGRLYVYILALPYAFMLFWLM